MRFHNQCIYITGASSGIGAELALKFAAEGGSVALFARRAEQLASCVAKIRSRGGRAEAYPCDVSNREDVLRAMAAAETALGPCTILVANAGVGFPISAARMNGDKAAQMLSVNVNGVIYATEAVLPGMLRRGSGQIVGISSLAAYRSLPGSAVYSASKSALNALLEGFRLELGPRGVGVTTICPGFIRTEMTGAAKIPMPMLLACDVATHRIVGAIHRRCRVYQFPRRMYWLIRLSRLVPEGFLAWLFKRLSRPNQPAG